MHRAEAVSGAVFNTLLRRNPARIVLSAEPHRTGVAHVHALLSLQTVLGEPFDPDRASPGAMGRSARKLWSDLFRVYGRSRVEAVSQEEAVARYVAKYVTKGLTAWHIW